MVIKNLRPEELGVSLSKAQIIELAKSRRIYFNNI